MPLSTYLLPALVAAAAVVALHLLAFRLFPKLGLLDFPERYGLKRKRLPYPTGIIAMVVGVGALLCLWEPTTQSLSVAAAVLALGIVCFIDDRLRLPPWLRLGVQLTIGIGLFLAGTRVYSFTNPLEGFIGGAVIPLDSWGVSLPFVPFDIPVWSGVFTVLWIGLTVNALNWFDGIPGQTTAVSALAFLTIGLLSASSRVDQPEIAAIAFVLAAIAGASFLFDFPPPKVVLGDTGVMFFGLMLGVLTIYAGGKVATAFLALGVPLTDAVVVALRRVLAGRSPLQGSASGEHLHHRLLAAGWSPRRIVLSSACIGAAFGGMALFLNTTEKFIAGGLLVMLVLLASWRARPLGEKKRP
ncbi:MAG: undecaprenyl/decaprenyl-phosphate alpha-N-acetylglucosaminyl 1-phosphate transferase [Candidatus Peribacteraceae bacterium]|nr:undecaprenyl/decaprenyl-phosphate alpha-N-acetylglucosaminyl 1-phosphate transferase [Candidatus Peribacteraceae bacterium]